MGGPAHRTWRAFTVRARSEKRVADRLSAAGIETLLPLRRALRQWSDRKKWVEVPLFSGYVFARVDERERLVVLETEAVVKTVSFGDTLAEVPEQEIEILRTLMSVPDRLEAVARDAFPVGAEVILTNGPLKGVRGHVTDHPRDAYLSGEVPSIRQSIRVQVPTDWTMRPPGDTSPAASPS